MEDKIIIHNAVKRKKNLGYYIDFDGNICSFKSWKKKRVHLIDSRNYYLCNKAVGNGVCGLATKNKNLVTCKNCIQRGKNVKKKS